MDEFESQELKNDDKSISSDLIRGHINTIILRALYDGDKYGYEIIADIETKSHGQYSMKQPSLYSALKRLESQGYITSYWGGAVGGGRRKYFSLTEEGRRISEQNQAEWEYSRTVIDSLVSDKAFDFAMPAPTALDMTALKKSTSKIPSSVEEEIEDNSEDRARLEEERAKLEEELNEQRTLFLEEQTRLTEEINRRELELEEAKRSLEEERLSFEEKQRVLSEDYEEKLSTLEEKKASYEEALVGNKAELLTQKSKLDEEYRMREDELAQERRRTQAELDEQREYLESERKRLELVSTEKEAEIEKLIAEKTALEEKIKFVEEQAKNELSVSQESVKREYEAKTAETNVLISDMKTREERLIIERDEAVREKDLYVTKYNEECHHTIEINTERMTEKREFEEQLEAQNALVVDLRNTITETNAELEDTVREKDFYINKYNEEQQRFTEENAQRLNEKRAYENRIAEYEREREEWANKENQLLMKERERYELALEQQRAYMEAENERILAEREKEMIHRNYINLVNTPPTPQSVNEYNYRTSTTQSEPSAKEEYKTSIQSLYLGTKKDVEAPVVRTKSSTNVNFFDLEERAKADGIRLNTVGSNKEKSQRTENVVHLGKVVFIAMIAVFLFTLFEGGIAMALSAQYALPSVYPYLIWCFGIVGLLVGGILYANKIGEHAVRNSGRALINGVVIFVLLAILDLILALSFRMDFGNIDLVMSYVVFPIVILFNIVIFSVAYTICMNRKK